MGTLRGSTPATDQPVGAGAGVYAGLLWNVSEAARVAAMRMDFLQSLVAAGDVTPTVRGTVGMGKGHRFDLRAVFGLAMVGWNLMVHKRLSRERVRDLFSQFSDWSQEAVEFAVWLHTPGGAAEEEFEQTAGRGNVGGDSQYTDDQLELLVTILERVHDSAVEKLNPTGSSGDALRRVIEQRAGKLFE